MKVIIAGGRDFDKGHVVIQAIKEFKQEHGQIDEIVCGMAKGADVMGLNYGRIWGIPVKEFPADWNRHGKSAGYVRNKQMAEYADALIAFWDGKSKGTAMMIDLARRHQIAMKIVYY